MVDVEVAVTQHAGCGAQRAFAQAAAGLVIEQHNVARTDEGADGTVSGHPAARLQGHVRQLDESRQPLAQVGGGGMRTGERGGAGTVGAEAADGELSRLFHQRVGR
jgi:hypothetical protein